MTSSLVHSLVPAHKFLEGDVVTIRCAHGDTVLYPLAEIEMVVSGLPVKVEAAVSDTLPVGVLLETDVPELTKLLGAEFSKSEQQGDAMVVVARAKAKRKLEEDILQREREISSPEQNQLHWRTWVQQRWRNKAHPRSRHPRRRQHRRQIREDN